MSNVIEGEWPTLASRAPPRDGSSPVADIVWMKGKLWRYPEGIQDD